MAVAFSAPERIGRGRTFLGRPKARGGKMLLFRIAQTPVIERLDNLRSRHQAGGDPLFVLIPPPPIAAVKTRMNANTRGSRVIRIERERSVAIGDGIGEAFERREPTRAIAPRVGVIWVEPQCRLEIGERRLVLFQ